MTHKSFHATTLMSIFNTALKEISGTIPHPLGTFEKATYSLYRFRKAGNPVYFFTTSCRQEDECIKLLVELWKKLSLPQGQFSIYKRTNGVEKLIFNNYKSESYYG